MYQRMVSVLFKLSYWLNKKKKNSLDFTDDVNYQVMRYYA